MKSAVLFTAGFYPLVHKYAERLKPFIYKLGFTLWFFCLVSIISIENQRNYCRLHTSSVRPSNVTVSQTDVITPVRHVMCND